VLITHDVEEAVYLSDEVFVFTPRPARVREAVRVPFPRPRSHELRREHEFQLIVRHITDLLTA
jgi:NitT/TauT family transport system ATP-binding protein